MSTCRLDLQKPSNCGRQILVTGHLPATLLNFCAGYCAEISDSLPEKMSPKLAEEFVTLWLAKIVDGVSNPYASGEMPEMSACCGYVRAVG